MARSSKGRTAAGRLKKGFTIKGGRVVRAKKKSRASPAPALSRRTVTVARGLSRRAAWMAAARKTGIPTGAVLGFTYARSSGRMVIRYRRD